MKFKPSIYNKEATDKYFEILRSLSGEERLKLGMGLYDLSMKIVESSIRNKYPGIGKEELKKKIKERLPK